MPGTPSDSLLLVGVCGPPHGIRGEIKVIPETDDPDRLRTLERLWIGPSAGEATERVVEGIRMQATKRGATVLVRLEGVTTPEQADTLRRLGVYAHQDDLPPLAEGEFYLHDLVGLRVLVETEAGTEAGGTVADVIDATAQPLLLIRREGRPDALVPDVPEIVVAVDLDAGTLTLRPPEGLLD